MLMCIDRLSRSVNCVQFLIYITKTCPKSAATMATNGPNTSEHMNSCNAGPSCASSCSVWDTTWITNMKKPLANNKYAVLILNRPISQDAHFLKRLWNHAAIRQTVDGGTRRWDQFLSTQKEEFTKNVKLPDLVTGDFDSITNEILEKYKKKGCKALHTPDQDYTDFTKALMELNIHSNKIGVELDNILVIVQNSGRFDQIIANVQTLFLARDKFLVCPKTKVYLLSDDSISWLLSPGEHVIPIAQENRKQKRPWCSLVPIGEACEKVTTSGLKWNLDGHSLKFGDIVSTSNTFDGLEEVSVKCSHTILWSMKAPSLMGP